MAGGGWDKFFNLFDGNSSSNCLPITWAIKQMLGDLLRTFSKKTSKSEITGTPYLGLIKMSKPMHNTQ